MRYAALLLAAAVAAPAAEIPQGSHALLRLVNSISTRTAREGDALAGAQHRFERVHRDEHLPAALLHVDAHRNGADGRLVQLFGTDQPVGRRGRRRNE